MPLALLLRQTVFTLWSSTHAATGKASKGDGETTEPVLHFTGTNSSFRTLQAVSDG